jgi:TolB protein
MKTLAMLTLLPAACFAQNLPQHLENLKQLTSGGNQNAESYWSPDGKRLIFQSTRDGSACDQQYIMNADGSNQHMVSTGKGVTTCGYFLKDGKSPAHRAPRRRTAAKVMCGRCTRSSKFTSPLMTARFLKN